MAMDAGSFVLIMSQLFLLCSAVQTYEAIDKDVNVWTDAEGKVKPGEEVEIFCAIRTNISNNLIWRLEDGTHCLGCYYSPNSTITPLKPVFKGKCRENPHFPRSSCKVDDIWMTSALTITLREEDIREWFCIGETGSISVSGSVVLETGSTTGGVIIGGIMAGAFVIGVVTFIAVILYKTRDPGYHDDTETLTPADGKLDEESSSRPSITKY